MAHFHTYLLGFLLGWNLTLCQSAIAQRSFGPEARRSTPTASIRQEVAAIYHAEVGTLEIGKNNHGPGPKKYLASCGLDEGFAYCACFVKWVLERCNIPTQGGNAWSPSWFPEERVIWKQGKAVDRFRSVKTYLTDRQALTGAKTASIPSSARSDGQNRGEGEPQQGDVFGLYFTKLGRIGHVGFVDQWGGPRGDDWVYTVEGNTNGEGSREGDGVHARRRLKRHIHIVANWIDQ